MKAIVTALHVSEAKALGPSGVTSSIDKLQIDGPWKISTCGIEGDTQADSGFHGGAEKALHHYPREHYPAWEADDWELAPILKSPSAFGENISTLGMTETTVHIGDLYRFGSCLLQVSQGRQPCWKLNLRFGRSDMAQRVQTTLRTGWYYRVIRSGTANSGDALELFERPQPAWPLSRLMWTLYKRCLDIEELAEISNLDELTSSWRNIALARIQTGQIEDWTARLNTPTRFQQS